MHQLCVIINVLSFIGQKRAQQLNKPIFLVNTHEIMLLFKQLESRGGIYDNHGIWNS